MLAVPAVAPPVTTPVAEPTVAVAVVPLVHVPAPVASVNVVVDPEQTLFVPLITRGVGFTVTVATV